MSPKNIAAAVVKRHPELKEEFSVKQLKLVKLAIEDAVVLSSGEFLGAEETDQVFKKRVPDSGNPFAALRAYRNRLDLTQRDLAKKSGIPQPHIAAMESGKRPIGLLAAKKLALALGVDYRKLV
jgi:DNA-binding XRE family transcriptional regulator